MSVGLFIMIQIAVGVGTIITDRTSVHAIRYLATFSVGVIVCSVLIMTSYRVRREIKEMFPGISDLSLDLETEKPRDNKSGPPEVASQVSKSNPSEQAQVQSRPSLFLDMKQTTEEKGTDNDQMVLEKKTKRQNVISSTKITSQLQASGRASKVTFRGAQRKLDLLLFESLIAFIVAGVFLMYYFVVDVSNRAKFSYCFRDEKANYSVQIDVTIYIPLAVIIVGQWYLSMPFSTLKRRFNQMCCIQYMI